MLMVGAFLCAGACCAVAGGVVCAVWVGCEGVAVCAPEWCVEGAIGLFPFVGVIACAGVCGVVV